MSTVIDPRCVTAPAGGLLKRDRVRVTVNVPTRAYRSLSAGAHEDDAAQWLFMRCTHVLGLLGKVRRASVGMTNETLTFTSTVTARRRSHFSGSTAQEIAALLPAGALVVVSRMDGRELR